MIRGGILIYVSPDISRGYDFNYLYVPLAQSNLFYRAVYCIVNLAEYLAPVLRIDNQQNIKIMKILILLKSFISLFYIIRYILRSMM